MKAQRALLMERLGYARYVSQGGDCSSVISDKMAVQKPPGLLAIHVNMPGVVPPEIARVLQCGDPPPANPSGDELDAFNKLNELYKRGNGYAIEQTTRPQTLGYGLADWPAGLAAWFYEKFAAWSYTDDHPERELTKDQMLDDITLYWLTNTGHLRRGSTGRTTLIISTLWTFRYGLAEPILTWMEDLTRQCVT